MADKSGVYSKFCQDCICNANTATQPKMMGNFKILSVFKILKQSLSLKQYQAIFKQSSSSIKPSSSRNLTAVFKDLRCSNSKVKMLWKWYQRTQTISQQDSNIIVYKLTGGYASSMSLIKEGSNFNSGTCSTLMV